MTELVPYQEDLRAALDALDALRHQVSASGDYIKPSFYGDVFDLPDPASLEDLLGPERYWEFIGTSGTHSVIDVQAVVAAGANDELGAIRPLSDEECAELFGTAQPGRADYDALSDSERLYDCVTAGRWTGRAAVLWTGASVRDCVLGHLGGLIASPHHGLRPTSPDKARRRACHPRLGDGVGGSRPRDRHAMVQPARRSAQANA